MTGIETDLMGLQPCSGVRPGCLGLYLVTSSLFDLLHCPQGGKISPYTQVGTLLFQLRVSIQFNKDPKLLLDNLNALHTCY